MKKLTLMLLLCFTVVVGAAQAETNDLHRAAKKGDIETVTKLLMETNMKMTVNAVDENGFTPLMYATIIGDLSISDLLIENGTDNRPLFQKSNLFLISVSAIVHV